MTELREDFPCNKYALDVINGKILTGKWIKLACKRHLEWFKRDDVYFDYEDVDRRIRFIQKMKHTDGAFAGKPFILMPWQYFILTIFGWKWKHNNLRVTKKMLLLIARKNSKSSTCAALALSSLICDKEMGNQVVTVANSSAQAKILFDMIKNYAESIDPNQIIFRRYRGSMEVPMLKSTIKIFSSDSQKQDGFSINFGIIDELHASKTLDSYNVLVSSMGAREQPLMCVLSSAGFLVGDEYPLYSMVNTCQDILIGSKQDDTQFSMLYQLDEDDDWKDESCWIKANPALDEIVRRSFLREQVNDALNNPSMEVGVKTKNFNIWCNSETTWIPRESLLAHTESINLDDFKDEYYCYVGVDLGSVSDFTAITYMIKKDDIFYFKTDLYIPDGSVEKSKNKDLYRKWIREGYLKTTHGERANYAEIVHDILEFNKKIPILEIAYDKYNAQEFVRLCNDEGMVMTPFSQTKGNFNMATKEFERRFFNNEIVLDDNPVVRWCFANAMLEYDKMDNCKPVKGSGKNNKIDAVISILESFGIYITREEQIGTISHI